MISPQVIWFPITLQATDSLEWFADLVEYVTMCVDIKLTILQNSERVSPIERLLTAIHEAPPIQLLPCKAALL